MPGLGGQGRCSDGLATFGMPGAILRVSIQSSQQSIALGSVIILILEKKLRLSERHGLNN